MVKFTAKAIATGTAGLGSLGGSGYIYWNSLPATWHELLQKEGFRIIDHDDYYKGIYFDHKDGLMVDIPELNSTSITSVAEATEKIKSWCKKELVTKPFWGGEGEKRRQLYVSICTTSGIITVKGRMGHNNKTSWIEDKETATQDKHWKAVFAIGKETDEFLNWINEGLATKLTKQSKPSENYDKLKNKCTKLLRTPFEEINDVNIYNHIFWWCKPWSEETIETRIKRIDKFWQRQDEGTKIKNKWDNTQQVKNKIKKDEKDDKSDPQDSDYKNWCDKNLKKKFYEEAANDGFYPDNYLMIREVCQFIA